MQALQQHRLLPHRHYSLHFVQHGAGRRVLLGPHIGTCAAVETSCSRRGHAKRGVLLIQAAQAGGGGSGDGSDAAPPPSSGGGGPGAISIGRPLPGPGYTFALAGFLKILTLGGLAVAAPNEAMRTAVGQYSQYLLVPVGLGLCWLAKQVVDAGLHENSRFLRGLTVVLVVLYFGLIKVLYTAVPGLQPVRRPRPPMGGPMADVRAELGDRFLAQRATNDGAVFGERPYQAERPGKGELYDDLSWYENRYPSPLAGSSSRGGAGGRGIDSEALLSDEEVAGIGSMGALGGGSAQWDVGGGLSDEGGPGLGMRRPVRRGIRARNSRSYLSANER